MVSPRSQFGWSLAVDFAALAVLLIGAVTNRELLFILGFVVLAASIGFRVSLQIRHRRRR